MSEKPMGFNRRVPKGPKFSRNIIARALNISYFTPRMDMLPDIPHGRPVLIAGPTASGKSSLALEVAERHGGVIVNADAIQVYANWRVLSARPSEEDERRVKHYLYGHVDRNAQYSVGHWLREVEPYLSGSERPIIVGGTGLYFTALTEGLADIPETPSEIRREAEYRLKSEGIEALLAELDRQTLERIDHRNPMRVQRAWEVQQSTGRGLAMWQDDTPPPLLHLDECVAIVLDAGKTWLDARIEHRFETMIQKGALEEVRANLAHWDPSLLSSKAIGATELVAHLKGQTTLHEACQAATTATRQFAKRQRTWFRSRMKGWQWVRANAL